MVQGNSGVAHPSLLEYNALSGKNEQSNDTFAFGSITKPTAVVNTDSASTISHCKVHVIFFTEGPFEIGSLCQQESQ